MAECDSLDEAFDALRKAWYDPLIEYAPTIGGTGGAIGGGIAGAQLGALGGPIAPITVPLGALVGAGLGAWGGRGAGRDVQTAHEEGGFVDPFTGEVQFETDPLTGAALTAGADIGMGLGFGHLLGRGARAVRSLRGVDDVADVVPTTRLDSGRARAVPLDDTGAVTRRQLEDARMASIADEMAAARRADAAATAARRSRVGRIGAGLGAAYGLYQLADMLGYNPWSDYPEVDTSLDPGMDAGYSGTASQMGGAQFGGMGVDPGYGFDTGMGYGAAGTGGYGAGTSMDQAFDSLQQTGQVGAGDASGMDPRYHDIWTGQWGHGPQHAGVGQ